MTQIEKIKAEIERLKEELYKQQDFRNSGSPIPVYDTNAIDGMLKVLDEVNGFINSLPSEQLSKEDLEEAVQEHVKKLYGENWMDFVYTQEAAFRAELSFKSGANWQKEQSTKLLKTIYSDCDNLKKDLDRVTTGNLPHRIGNIKFSITGIQVIIKQEMEDEQ